MTKFAFPNNERFLRSLSSLMSRFYSIGGSSILSVQIFQNIAQGISLADFFVAVREYIPSQEIAFYRICTTHGYAQVIDNWLRESSREFTMKCRWSAVSLSALRWTDIFPSFVLYHQFFLLLPDPIRDFIRVINF